MAQRHQLVRERREDAEDSGHKAINYRTEPLWKRMNYAPETPLEITRTFDFTNVLYQRAGGRRSADSGIHGQGRRQRPLSES